MRKLFLTTCLACGLLLACSLPAFCQNYKVGAAFAGGINMKMPGTIEISDSVAVLTIKGFVQRYDVVKKVNNLIYITDGVMTHTLAFVPKKGKIKGFAYTVFISFMQDKRQSDAVIAYYATETK